MIARNLIFMKIFKLPKSRMAAVKDRIVNVPINEEDIRKTIKSLPRTPTEAGIIPVKLKRKENFKNTHIEEYISIPKIKAALKILKKLGHMYYQFIKETDLDSFEERCATSDAEGFEFLFGNEEHDKKNEEQTIAENTNELDTTEIELEEYITKDPVAKFQFEYIGNTCFGNDVPEISVPDEANEPLCIAPGEGKIPTNLLMDDDWDMKAHPCLDPSGQNNLNKEREVKQSALKFF